MLQLLPALGTSVLEPDLEGEGTRRRRNGWLSGNSIWFNQRDLRGLPARINSGVKYDCDSMTDHPGAWDSITTFNPPNLKTIIGTVVVFYSFELQSGDS